MANFVYAKCKDAILNGLIDFNSNSIKILIVNSSYTPNQNSDQFVSDIPSNSRLAYSSGLSNKTILNGVLDASDLVIPSYSRSSLQCSCFI